MSAAAFDPRPIVDAYIEDLRPYMQGDEKDLTYSIGSEVRDLRDFMARAALQPILPLVRDTIAACAAGGAVSAASAVEIHEGIKAFAVTLSGKAEVSVLCLVADERRIAFSLAGNEEGFSLSMGIWQADDAGEMTERERKSQAAYGQVGEYHARAGYLTYRRRAEGRESWAGHLREEQLGNFLRACEALRPLVLSRGFERLPTPEEAMARYKEAQDMNFMMLASEMGKGRNLHPGLVLDGHWPGEACAATFRAFQGAHLLRVTTAEAKKLVANHDTMVKHGYVWGEKRLRYSDTDKICFAIPLDRQDRIATVHENIDLFSDAKRFLIVADRAEEGAVTRVEIHAMRRNRWEAHPLNPTWQPEMIERLLSDTLPAPAASANLETGETHIDLDAFELASYFEHIVTNDSWAAEVLDTHQELPCGCKDDQDFDNGDPDEIDDDVEEDAEDGVEP